MQVIRGITTSVLIAVSVCFALSFLPIHTLQMDTVFQKNIVATATDPVKRVVDACQALRIDGRIDQIVRHDSGVSVVFSSNQITLNDQVYGDIYNLLYRIFSIANVPTITIKVVAAQSGDVICTVDALQAALTSPLPKKDEIVSYVLQHFDIQLP